MDPAGMVRASSLAVVAWVDGGGAPRATGVVALTRGPVPVLALTFARADLARTLAGQGAEPSTGQVALVLTETRSTGAGFVPRVLHATTRLEVDLSGDLYRGELIVQELHRYPPSRLLADSPLLCREHWWYLPRLVLELPDPEVSDLPVGTDGSARQVLVTVDGDRPSISLARLSGQNGPGERPGLELLGGADPVPGPALLFGQDASFPDLERWEEWSWAGRVERSGSGWTLAVAQAPDRVGLPGVRRLLGRWQAHRRLERACRQGLGGWSRPPP
jgi:hypothetical protein